jgi:ubiquinone/menaquinone biosynthesis C-methylase UbiE|tara:strand:- start:395 stop:1111 length:717 start_codon:yes stop_codon:yes gene_type:complete
MKDLKNWDKKTWLSSSKYISSIINFLEKRIKFDKEIKILDIGCGRGRIISTFSKKYKMSNLPLGIDIVDHKNAARKIKFIKINAIKYLSKTKEKFDLILFKQSIHFFKPIEIKKILDFSKKKLNPNGKIMILALHPKNNHWPLFKIFKIKLMQSLKKDKKILDLIKLNFKKYKINYFNFKVKITKVSYLEMIKNRFTSCLLNLSSEELKTGMKEIKKNYNKKIKFYDKLICISYKKEW